MIHDFKFKDGARVPKDVTPEGVVSERDRIKAEHGDITIATATGAVLADPDKYPNLRAFGPADKDEAFRNGIAQGIRMAFAAVVIERIDRPGAEPREIRFIQSVPRKEPEYLTLDEVRASRPDARLLYRQIQAEVASFTRRLRDMMGELGEILDDEEGEEKAA